MPKTSTAFLERHSSRHTTRGRSHCIYYSSVVVNKGHRARSAARFGNRCSFIYLRLYVWTLPAIADDINATSATRAPAAAAAGMASLCLLYAYRHRAAAAHTTSAGAACNTAARTAARASPAQHKRQRGAQPRGNRVVFIAACLYAYLPLTRLLHIAHWLWLRHNAYGFYVAFMFIYLRIPRHIPPHGHHSGSVG